MTGRWRLPLRLVVAVGLAHGAHEEAAAGACLARVAAHFRFVSSLAPPPCRDDFATMAQRHFFRTGRAAEVGVFEGAFAAHNVQSWRGHYYAIDAWAPRPGDPGDKNFKSPNTHRRVMATAREAIHKATGGNSSRYTLMQALSTDAAPKFPDGYFDWLYVDALHTREAVARDLRAWWPKLREGGLFSGDDYGDIRNTEYLSPLRYRRIVDGRYWNSTKRPGKGWVAGRAPYKQANQWGVISAVQNFARSVNGSVHVTWGLDCYPWPAWWIVRQPDCAFL